MRTVFVLLVVASLGACGGGRDVDSLLGAKCDDDRDCEERCLGPNNEFPDGLCSYQCDTDSECPSDAWCVEVQGGVCMFDCFEDRDCDFLGREWVCRDRDQRDGGGKVSVCIGR